MYSGIKVKEMGDISGETISIIIAILVATSGSMALTLTLYIRLDRRFDAVERRFDAVDRRFEAVEHRFERVEDDIKRVEDDIKVLINDVGEVKGALGVSRTGREREPSETAV